MYSPKFIIPIHSPKISSVITGNISSCVHQHTSRPTSITEPAWRPTAESNQERRLYKSKSSFRIPEYSSAYQKMTIMQISHLHSPIRSHAYPIQQHCYQGKQ